MQVKITQHKPNPGGLINLQKRNMEKSVKWATVFVDATEEVANYARLLSLLVEEGTPRLKQYMLEHLPAGCQSLGDAVRLKEPLFQTLQKKGVLNRRQMNILFPPLNGEPNMDDIDLSLWYILITNMSSELSRRQWSRMEHKKQLLSTDKFPEHDILRLRNLRNAMCHLLPPQIDNQAYTENWRHQPTAFPVADALV